MCQANLPASAFAWRHPTWDGGQLGIVQRHKSPPELFRRNRVGYATCANLHARSQRNCHGSGRSARGAEGAGAVARGELGELRSAVSVERAWEAVFPSRATPTCLELGRASRAAWQPQCLRFATPTYEPFHDCDNSGEDIIFHSELATGCRHN